jgi:hypothetical protein
MTNVLVALREPTSRTRVLAAPTVSVLATAVTDVRRCPSRPPTANQADAPRSGDYRRHGMERGSWDVLAGWPAPAGVGRHL